MRAIFFFTLAGSEENLLKAQHPGTAEPFRIAPAKPVAYTSLVKTRVEDALINWEPRIDVKEVKVTSDPEERNKLLIDLSYRVRATNSVHNLVYPFYLQEGTPA